MPNPQRLDILRQLREEAGLTQTDMARLCGLRGRQSHQTAGAWERGMITPTATRRTRFLAYLWDSLRLRGDTAHFEALWEVLVEEWNWEPISDQEWSSFTHQERAKRPALDDLQQKLTQLEGAVRQIQIGASGQATPNPPSESTILHTEVSPANNVWLVAASADEVPEPTPLPPKSKMPYRKNPLFVGREEVLLRIATSLDIDKPIATYRTPTMAITGLGGIGKTQLACEFVHRYGRYFPGGVFWLSFDNPEAIQSEFAACGGSDALALAPDFDTRALDEKVALVRAALQEPIARLLIFDNCEDPQLLHQWRPTSGGCHILLTSRRGVWEPILDVQQLSLDGLARPEGVELLGKYLPQADEYFLREITKELGDLPLALHLAGSYLYRYRRSVEPSEYLAQIRNPEVLQHPSLNGKGLSPTDHTQHVARTFALSYEQLDLAQPADQLAHHILVHLACLAPGEYVPYTLLLRSLQPEKARVPTAVDDALSRLFELGLVEAVGDAELRMHRLIATFVQDAVPAPVQEAQRALEVIVSEELQHINQIVSPLTFMPWQVHLRYVARTASLRRDEQGAVLCRHLGRHLWLLGDYTGASHFLGESLAICLSQLGEEHLATAAAHHQMGILNEQLGNLEAAHRHYEQALATRLQLAGEDDADTVDTLVDLGDLLWSERRLDEAIAHLERALAICDRALGEDHLVAAEAANNLSMFLLEGKGDALGARPYLERALRIRRQKLGENHPFTATAYNNMGYLLQELGQLESAEGYYQQALQIRLNSLGEHHPDTAHSLYSIGKVLRVQGRLQEAKDHFDQALAIYVASIGNEHALTASCQNELGVLYLEQKEIARARHALEHALRVRQAIYKVHHPQIAVTLQNLGLVLWIEQEMGAAKRHLTQALQIRQETLGEDHRLTGETLLFLSQLLGECGEAAEAEMLFTQARHIYENRLGEEPQEIERRLSWLHHILALP